jgi:hypothetical protein
MLKSNFSVSACACWHVYESRLGLEMMTDAPRATKKELTLAINKKTISSMASISFIAHKHNVSLPDNILSLYMQHGRWKEHFPLSVSTEQPRI